jgi:hypothetical protein
MKQNTVIEAAVQSERVEPTGLVTLGELAGEGFGWDGLFIRTPKDAVDVLVRHLGGLVVFDDIGRRCVTRDTARGLFAERATAERQQREVSERNAAKLAEVADENRPRGGIPADQVPDGVLPASAMLQAAKEAEPRPRSVLEEALDNGALTYHPIRDES